MTAMNNAQASTKLYSSPVWSLTFTACTNVHWGEGHPVKNQVSVQTK
jgi:hypothetical protein